MTAKTGKIAKVKDPFEIHWDDLKKLPFHQREKVSEVFPQIHCMLASPRTHSYYKPYLNLTHTWLRIPQSFWAVDFVGLAKFLLTEVPKGKPLSHRLILLLKFVRRIPPEEVQRIIIAHELDAEKGVFKNFVKNEEKYTAYERAILESPLLRMEWEQIKASFPVHIYRSPDTGIIRRRMVCERNFKIGWEFTDEVTAFFEAIFTAFCADWNLYGMGFNKPLLLKLSVNNTPFGLQSMYPKYMNVDGYRDLNWKAHGEIPKAYGVIREGVKTLNARRELEDEAIRTLTASLRAEERELQGDERIAFIISEARLSPDTDERRIRRLNEIAREILATR